LIFEKFFIYNYEEIKCIFYRKVCLSLFFYTQSLFIYKNLENNRRKIPPKSKKQGIKANYIPPTNNKNKALKKDNNNIYIQ